MNSYGGCPAASRKAPALEASSKRTSSTTPLATRSLLRREHRRACTSSVTSCNYSAENYKTKHGHVATSSVTDNSLNSGTSPPTARAKKSGEVTISQLKKFLDTKIHLVHKENDDGSTKSRNRKIFARDTANSSCLLDGKDYAAMRAAEAEAAQEGITKTLLLAEDDLGEGDSVVFQKLLHRNSYHATTPMTGKKISEREQARQNKPQRPLFSEQSKLTVCVPRLQLDLVRAVNPPDCAPAPSVQETKDARPSPSSNSWVSSVEKNTTIFARLKLQCALAVKFGMTTKFVANQFLCYEGKSRAEMVIFFDDREGGIPWLY
ncbi:unnamed protein product [Amoebophrya sp. A120]|nr:unnamed protein product [Amoebophrya sp. A120]|eukprot:GSA120T00009335001.1